MSVAEIKKSDIVAEYARGTNDTGSPDHSRVSTSRPLVASSTLPMLTAAATKNTGM